MKVMMIDDSSVMRLSAEQALLAAGCEVNSAENGFEALSHIVAWRPDLILMDIVMPKLDGYQTCSLVKHNPHFRNIPVIMLSSKEGEYDKAKARVVGADAYLTKPFTPDHLIQTLQQYWPLP
jgi:twitching motility two-component system response regulator PilG